MGRPEEPNGADSAGTVPRSVVVDPVYDWGPDVRPRTPYHRTVIYEAHVKGLTQLHPDVPGELRGHPGRSPGLPPTDWTYSPKSLAFARGDRD